MSLNPKYPKKRKCGTSMYACEDYNHGDEFYRESHDGKVYKVNRDKDESSIRKLMREEMKDEGKKTFPRKVVSTGYGKKYEYDGDDDSYFRKQKSNRGKKPVTNKTKKTTTKRKVKK